MHGSASDRVTERRSDVGSAVSHLMRTAKDRGDSPPIQQVCRCQHPNRDLSLSQMGSSTL